MALSLSDNDHNKLDACNIQTELDLGVYEEALRDIYFSFEYGIKQ